MTNTNNKIVTLGGAKITALKDIAADALELTPENDPVPFDVMWHPMFAKWEEQNPISGASTVLIFSDTPQVIGATQGAEIVYQFGVADAVQPGVFVVGRSPHGNAWRLKESTADHQENCKAIATAGLDQQFCVVLGICKRHVIVLPNGISGESVKLPLNVAGTPLSEETLDNHLRGFADECLNGQEYRRNIWKDAPKWIPVELAEQEIQKLLVCGLRTAFLGYSICGETNLPNGRIDVSIISKDPEEARRAVLELKVARSKNSSGVKVAESVVLAHLKDGVTQAAEYSKKIGATHKSLCAYDMRATKGGKVINEVQACCSDNQVKLRVYDIYNSSKSTRSAAAASAA